MQYFISFPKLIFTFKTAHFMKQQQYFQKVMVYKHSQQYLPSSAGASVVDLAFFENFIKLPALDKTYQCWVQALGCHLVKNGDFDQSKGWIESSIVSFIYFILI